MRTFGNETSFAHDWQFWSLALFFDDYAHREQEGTEMCHGICLKRKKLLLFSSVFKGIAGFTLTKTPTNRGPAMFQQAANRAGLRLMQIDLYEGRTVYHDFWTQFSHTRIFVKQKPIGHGVVAHRVIKSACELIGIKDLEAVVEGSHNPNSMIKAFFLGLLRQKTHQTLADDKGLHLLELRGENDFFPKVSKIRSCHIYIKIHLLFI